MIFVLILFSPCCNLRLAVVDGQNHLRNGLVHETNKYRKDCKPDENATHEDNTLGFRGLDVNSVVHTSGRNYLEYLCSV